MAFPYFGFGVPCVVGWVGPAWGSVLLVGICAMLGKYFDPVGDRDQYGSQNSAHRVLKFPGTVLMSLQCKLSTVTQRIVVQSEVC